MTTHMPFDKLRLDSGSFANPRTTTGLDEASIRELAVHIGLHGILNPPLVLESGLVIAGQRRYRAIEFLLAWFSSLRRYPDDEGGAKFRELFGDLTSDDLELVTRQTRSLEDLGVPVRVLAVGLGRAEGLALADNIQREDLSTFEVAKYLAFLIGQGLTQADIVRLIGKSKTWVSRRITTFNSCHDEVLRAWEAGAISFEAAQDLAKLPAAEQLRQMRGPVPRGIRGLANRPGIDTVKEILGELEKRGLSETSHTEGVWESTKVGRARYATGVRDALRWIAGEKASMEFAQLVEGDHAT